MNLSILPISEYLSFEEVRQLEFPPTQSFTFSPGDTATTVVVPEPLTLMGSVSAISLGVLFKRKRLYCQNKSLEKDSSFYS